MLCQNPDCQTKEEVGYHSTPWGVFCVICVPLPGDYEETDYSDPWQVPGEPSASDIHSITRRED